MYGFAASKRAVASLSVSSAFLHQETVTFILCESYGCRRLTGKGGGQREGEETLLSSICLNLPCFRVPVCHRGREGRRPRGPSPLALLLSLPSVENETTREGRGGGEGSYEGSNSAAPHVRRERREASAKVHNCARRGRGWRERRTPFLVLLTNTRGLS